MREFLEKVLAGQDLTRQEANRVSHLLIEDVVTPSQVGALLAALRMKGETPTEILGFVEAMREHAVRFECPIRPLIDTCGTGGDGSGSFNISTLAALVVAACGQPVAKHGNRAASSRCGSADFLEALGIRVDLDPVAARRSLEETGFAFLLAPRYHPATRRVAAIRRELKIETVFNILGPLTNPAVPEFQLVGASSLSKARKMAEVLRLLNVPRAFVVYNELGYDELTPWGRNWVIEVHHGESREFVLDANGSAQGEDPVTALRGGSPEDNAQIGRSVLRGERGPQRETTIMNAGMALWVAGRAQDLRQGMEQAAEAIDSGRALALVETLRRLFPYGGTYSGKNFRR